MRATNRITFIAEAGVNHNGDFEKALQLIDIAVKARADYIKFQCFTAESLVDLLTPKADYQIANCGAQEDQYEMLKKLELSKDQFSTLFKKCEEKGIGFASTPFDIEYAHFLNDLGVDFFKIASGEISNYPLLKTVASFKKPVIFSTGMSVYEDIELALNTLLKYGLTKEQVTILHCTTDYPTPLEHVNLKTMQSIQKQFNTRVGYSDHTQGILVPPLAVSLGAKVLEKHFTIDQNLPGPDHRASLTPEQLESVIRDCHKCYLALGSENKTVTEIEVKTRKLIRKSIFSSCNIEKGEIFREENLTTKRPATGLDPMKSWKHLIGKKAKFSYKKNDFIKNEEVQDDK